MAVGIYRANVWFPFLALMAASAALAMPPAASALAAPDAKAPSAGSAVKLTPLGQFRVRMDKAWNGVLSAEQAEIAALNKATDMAMKRGDAKAVVSAQNLLSVVRGRLKAEKSEPPFPPYFQSTASPFGLPPGLPASLRAFEKQRDARVMAAISLSQRARAQYIKALVAAERAKVMQLKLLVRKDMKAGNPAAVVSDMRKLRVAEQQLNHPAPIGPAAQSPGLLVAKTWRSPPGALFTGRADQSQAGVNPTGGTQWGGGRSGVITSGLGPFGGRAAAAPQGDATSPSGGWFASHPAGVDSPFRHFADAIAQHKWPALKKAALKPVPPYSVLSLAAQLARYHADPGKLVGMRVRMVLIRRHAGDPYVAGTGDKQTSVTRRDRLERLSLRRQIEKHFQAIRRAARARQMAEHHYQMGLQEAAAPYAGEWQVPPPIAHAEHHDRSAIDDLSRRVQRRDLRSLSRAYFSMPDRVDLVSCAGGTPPRSGAVYGIVVGVATSQVDRQTPALALPGGVSVREAALPEYLGLTASPIGPYLATVLALNIPSRRISSCKVLTLKILCCGRRPNFLQGAGIPAPVAGPVKGYIFQMKDGSRVRAKTYRVGKTYFYTKWDGVEIPLTKSLVRKIIPVR